LHTCHNITYHPDLHSHCFYHFFVYNYFHFTDENGGIFWIYRSQSFHLLLHTAVRWPVMGSNDGVLDTGTKRYIIVAAEYKGQIKTGSTITTRYAYLISNYNRMSENCVTIYHNAHGIIILLLCSSATTNETL